MNWFKQNPFLGGLGLCTVVGVAAALYFLIAQNSSFTEESDAYTSNSSTLNNLQSAKPFPNEANLKLAETETARAGEILRKLAEVAAQQAAPLDPSLTPRQFQDKLNAEVGAVAKEAASAGTRLPDNFYLGFGAYQSQPPSPAAAPLLGQQLETVSHVVRLLLQARVREITSLDRPPLPAESDAGEKRDASSPANDIPDLFLPTFDIEFVADQANFREAMNAIVTGKPMVLLRLLRILNSQPAPPSKAATQEGGEGTGDKSTGRVPVVFGQENLSVKMRLAAVSIMEQNKK